MSLLCSSHAFAQIQDSDVGWRERTAGEASQSDDPGTAMRLGVEIHAGGPYSAVAGSPITLRGRYTVAGHTRNSERLKSIGEALQSYLREHGSYPPGALLNADGQPTVSWRVLILPYLGHKDLYDRFDLTKAWDDPVNLRLLKRMPAAYRKNGADPDTTETGFAGIEGVNSLFANASADLNGGRPGNGITLAERIAAGPVGAEVHLPWTAPGDIDIAATNQLGSPRGFAGEGNAFTPLLFLDGAIHLIPNNIDRGSMRTWSLVSGYVACPCAPPSSVSAELHASWDLGSNGTSNSEGWSVTFLARQPGTYPVTIHAADQFGNTYNKSTRVTVR